MGGALKRWMFACAAVQGRGHQASGDPCQDVVAGRQANGVTALALADGAGSAAHSELGARLVVDETLRFVTERFAAALNGDLAVVRAEIVDALRARLDAEARERSLAVRDLASTLLFVAVTEDAFVAGHLGDGVIGCEQDGTTKVLSHPQHGEFLNETVFVTSSSARERLVLERGALASHATFILMSDGTADSLYSRRERALAPGARSISGWLDARSPAQVDEALTRALRDVIGQQTRDDCSIGLLRRVSAPVNALGAMNDDFQKSFLGCTGDRSVRTRRVIALAMAAHRASVDEVARTTGLSKGTVRRHARDLARLFPSWVASGGPA
jgi:hypothetical protein